MRAVIVIENTIEKKSQCKMLLQDSVWNNPGRGYSKEILQLQ